MAAQDGRFVLYYIFIIIIIIVYPSRDNVITRAHSRRAFGSRVAVRWVVGAGRGAGHQSNEGPLTGAKQISSRTAVPFVKAISI